MNKIMKKKVAIGLVAILLIVGSTACSQPKSSGTVSEEKTNTSETVAQTKLSDAANKILESKIELLPESGKKAVNLLKKYVDFNLYMLNLNSDIIDDNETTEDISTIKIDGKTFKLGMSYDDIISLGYKPKDSSYADSRSNESMEFTNDEGNSIELTFRDKDDSNKTIKEGYVLDELKVEVENREVFLDKLGENSTISDIIKVLGQPSRVGIDNDYLGVVLGYSKLNSIQRVTFCNDLETEKIISIEISGYENEDKLSTEELNYLKELNKESVKSRQKEIKILKKYFDVDLYMINGGYIEDRKTDKDLSSIEIDGKKFQLGMSYNDVIAMGYTPSDSSFAREKPGSSEKSETFTNDKGKSISLSFKTKSNSKSIKESGYLYQISLELENQQILFNNIKEDSKIPDIIDALGNPYSSYTGYGDVLDTRIEYVSKKESYHTTFCINLGEEKITKINFVKYEF